ncbi:MAG: hypothetical protein ACP5I7_00960 [Sulfolobales archaeon]|jgi:hypothetical protein
MSNKKCIEAKATIIETQVIIETQDNKKAVIPQRVLCEVLKRYNICLSQEILKQIKCY